MKFKKYLYALCVVTLLAVLLTVPAFAALITLAQGAYCMRFPYNTMVLAAGHFKQTQTSSFIEMILNIVISVVFVFRFGLIGVAIGTLVSMVYRTIYLAWYLSWNIINRPFRHFWKHIAVDILTVILILASTMWIKLEMKTYFYWVIMAVKVGLISVAIVGAVNYLFYRKEMKNSLKKFIPRKIR